MKKEKRKDNIENIKNALDKREALEKKERDKKNADTKKQGIKKEPTEEVVPDDSRSLHDQISFIVDSAVETYYYSYNILYFFPLPYFYQFQKYR